MRLLARLAAAGAMAALAFPGGALAEVKTLVFTAPPITVEPYGVARGVQLAPSPQVDGYVVGISADVVDPQGNPVPHQDVMLHHIVFAKVGAPDYTCQGVRGFDGTTAPFQTQRFYAAGEEHFALALPEGYGYPNRGQDAWGLLYMLMNHHARASTVQVRYSVRYAAGEPRTAVKPIWLDIRNCLADPVFNVPGTGGPGSRYLQRSDFRLPESGRVVAAGGHMHGGGVSLDVTDTSCGSIFTSYPTWGLGPVRPVMHEPGPLRTTALVDSAGRPVRAGDTLRLTATYDNTKPHVRVMGIVVLYLAPGPVSACGPFASPIPAPTQAEPVTIELLKAPSGPVVRNIRSTWVGEFAFGAQRVSLRRGTRFTWRFEGRVQHDVTLASGPIGFSSRSMASGTYSFRFSRSGTYRLFCSLHPSRMTQIVTVR